MGSELFTQIVKMTETELDAFGSDSIALCQGRLSLTSGLSVTTSNVLAATTIYFTLHQGDRIALYSGTQWGLVSFSETSIAVPSTTSTPFDVFAYNNGGTLTLETVDWASDTARATALTTQDGVYVKTGAVTRRYLGTGRTTDVSGQIEDSAKKRFLWNACNRVPRKLLAQSSADSWQYAPGTASWRAANATTTTGVTRVEYVVGQVTEPVTLEVHMPKTTNTFLGGFSLGIGINSTSTSSSDIGGQAWGGLAMSSFNTYRGWQSLGYSFAQWLENVASGKAIEFFTNNQSGGIQRQGGLIGEIWG